MTEFDHAFIAPVLLSRGGMTAHKLPLPEAVDADVRAAPTRRVIGTLNGEPFRAAVHSSQEDPFLFLMLSKRRMRDLDLEMGALVEVEMSVDPDPDFVETGDELAAALDADADAREVWEGLTPGVRRGIAYTVTSAKRVQTRESRAADTVRRLRDGTHPRLRRR
ncbi:MAG: YdeI/OmpD-associated family protein [Bacteroidota bacterium]